MWKCNCRTQLPEGLANLLISTVQIVTWRGTDLSGERNEERQCCWKVHCSKCRVPLGLPGIELDPQQFETSDYLTETWTTHVLFVKKKNMATENNIFLFRTLPSNYQRAALVNHKKIRSFQKTFTLPLRICRRYHRGYWQFCKTLFKRIALGCWKVQGTNHDPGGQERLNVFCNVNRNPLTQWKWSYSHCTFLLQSTCKLQVPNITHIYR